MENKLESKEKDDEQEKIVSLLKDLLLRIQDTRQKVGRSVNKIYEVMELVCNRDKNATDKILAVYKSLNEPIEKLGSLVGLRKEPSIKKASSTQQIEGDNEQRTKEEKILSALAVLEVRLRDADIYTVEVMGFIRQKDLIAKEKIRALCESLREPLEKLKNLI